MVETLMFNDLRHWRHSRFDDSLLEVGLTVFNADCYGKPVSKWGKAPHDVLTYARDWLDLEQAHLALQSMGFVAKNDVVWVREIENEAGL